MPSYTVRSVIRWAPCEAQEKNYLYEERITAWNARSLDEAIELAESEAKTYAAKEGFHTLDFFQAYWMFSEVDFIPQGSEVFSLLRESDLEADEYLDTFFDTGAERETEYGSTEQRQKGSRTRRSSEAEFRAGQASSPMIDLPEINLP